MMYICIMEINRNTINPLTIIFKSEKKAKVYAIRAAKAHGVYGKNELMRYVKTDIVEKCINDVENEYAVELN